MNDSGVLTPIDADGDGITDYYIYAPPEGVAVNDASVSHAARCARRHGIAPRAFAGFISDMLYAKQAQNDHAAYEHARGMEQLHAEWGAYFEDNVAEAAALMTDLGFGPRLAGDPRLLYSFHLIASRLAGKDAADPTSPDAAEREQALAAIRAIRADAAHPYHHVAHPAHSRAVTDMEGLYRIAYPG